MSQMTVTLDEAVSYAERSVASGQLAQAEQLCREILAAYPDHPPALQTLAVVAQRAGRPELAIKLAKRVVELAPSGNAFNALASFYHTQGQLDEARGFYEQALALMPDHPEANSNYGDLLRAKDELEASVTVCRRALAVDPNFAEASNNLGNALRQLGRMDEAVAAYRKAVRILPGYAAAHSNLAAALIDRGDHEEAVTASRVAIANDPRYTDAYINLSNALKALHRLDEATDALLQARVLKPDEGLIHSNLGNIYKDEARIEEALESYRAAVTLRPENAHIHSNLVFFHQFVPGMPAAEIRAAQERWNRSFAVPLRAECAPHANDPSPDRRLRVGYLSPDFREHAVSFFAAPLMTAHHREQVEVYCYHDHPGNDRVTRQFRKRADVWREVAGRKDGALAQQIREDRIDILVDLAMHSSSNRLLVFARKPAPIQVSWLAYPGTTGLETIDYRLTDAHMDPPGTDDATSSEKPVRLPDSWVCYEPYQDFPEVSPLPAMANGWVTFGSLNNFCKVNREVLACWARLLRQIPRSRFTFYCPESKGRRDALAFLTSEGIAAERVTVFGHLPRGQFLREYSRVDIGLDPFPFNGMTTTCHSLWMGVPVIALAGDAPCSRASAGLLATAGLREWVATSRDEYIRIAVDCARDLRGLAALRATLRERLRASPLMDAERFATGIEEAYRRMWKTWCASRTGNS